ncbi:MAG TPA: hypothetical protein VFW03_22810 [Gemmatimonadaceae bacterium]|nr:hypothetical protein [Gemmatimonadaceae bacterium]
MTTHHRPVGVHVRQAADLVTRAGGDAIEVTEFEGLALPDSFAARAVTCVPGGHIVANSRSTDL